MKYLDIRDNDVNLHFKPIFVNKDKIFAIREQYFENHSVNINFSGFYIYELESRKWSRYPSKKEITYYWNNNLKSNIIYANVKEEAINYNIDIQIFNVESKKENLILNYIAVKKQNNMLMSAFQSVGIYPINDNYILFKLNDEQSKMFIFDINHQRTYQIYDSNLLIYNIQNVITFKIDEKEYVLIKTGTDVIEDKRELYLRDKHKPSFIKHYESYVDGINILMFIELDDFIQQIKNVNVDVNFKLIVKKTYDAGIRLVGNYKSKVYYLVSHFDKEYSEIVCYDVEKKEYTINQLEYEPQFIKLCLGYMIYTKDNNYVIINIENNNCFSYPINIGIANAIIDERYIITEQLEYIGDKFDSVTYKYDLVSNLVVEKQSGRVYMSEDESMVVLF